jgi:tetratricopeptide (TPR) repeat protein
MPTDRGDSPQGGDAMGDQQEAEILGLLSKAAEALIEKDSDTAIALAETILDIEDVPDEAWVAALTVRAKALLVEGLLPDALEDLDSALEVMPDNALTRVTRGYVQRCMGMLDEAEADYERAVELDPDGEPGQTAKDLLTKLRDDPDEPDEPWAVGVGRPLVTFEETWGAIALPDSWEQSTEPLDPPASRWTTGDVDLDLVIAGALPTEETSLEEVFDAIIAHNSKAVGELFDERTVVSTGEEMGGLPAHLITASSTVPRLVLATLILQGPVQVLTARLLDHRPGAEADQCVNQLTSILEGARLPA